MRTKISLLIVLLFSYNFAHSSGGGSGPGIVGCDGISVNQDGEICNNSFKSAKFSSFDSHTLKFLLQNDNDVIIEASATELELELNSPLLLDAIEESYYSNNNDWVEI